MQQLNSSISISMKVNLGNYESAEAYLSVNNITADTTPEEIQSLLDGPVKISYDELKIRMKEKIQQLRNK
jgi:hypothetical protein